MLPAAAAQGDYDIMVLVAGCHATDVGQPRHGVCRSYIRTYRKVGDGLLVRA